MSKWKYMTLNQLFNNMFISELVVNMKKCLDTAWKLLYNIFYGAKQSEPKQ